MTDFNSFLCGFWPTLQPTAHAPQSSWGIFTCDSVTSLSCFQLPVTPCCTLIEIQAPCHDLQVHLPTYAKLEAVWRRREKRGLGEPPTLSGPGIWRHPWPLEYSSQKKKKMGWPFKIPFIFALELLSFFSNIFSIKAQNTTNNLTPHCMLSISI